jgi:antitoxin (DNA-binding transcriptional repressor) of toxin-antitoxin stability system
VREELSVTEASRRGVARLVADAAHGAEVVVFRHHAPVAAVVGIDRLAELDALRADLRDLALVVARAADDDGRRTAIEEVLAAFGPAAAGADG